MVVEGWGFGFVLEPQERSTLNWPWTPTKVFKSERGHMYDTKSLADPESCNRTMITSTGVNLQQSGWKRLHRVQWKLSQDCNADGCSIDMTKVPKNEEWKTFRLTEVTKLRDLFSKRLEANNSRGKRSTRSWREKKIHFFLCYRHWRNLVLNPHRSQNNSKFMFCSQLDLFCCKRKKETALLL